MIKIDKRVNYRSFGFIPNNSFRYNLFGKFFGHKNLIKRLQAKDIMSVLDIRPTDYVLDFGCGVGYFTIEMAKLAEKAFGIDINPNIKEIKIPEFLYHRLDYIRASGIELPFPENYFDRILASEVLPMIEDPDVFLKEIKRVLKPNGLLVISNGAGHPVIKKAFEKKSILFRWLKRRYSEKMPGSYEEYCSTLQKAFGTSQKRFLDENEILALLIKNGLTIQSVDYTPGYIAGTYFSWSQFLLYLRKGKTLSQKGFLFKYLIFSLIQVFEKKRYKGGLLCVVENS